MSRITGIDIDTVLNYKEQRQMSFYYRKFIKYQYT